MWVVREGGRTDVNQRRWWWGRRRRKRGWCYTFPSPCRAFCFFCHCFTRCVKRKSHFPALAPLGAPMELCTQFSQSLFRFPGRFREKRARGEVCALLPGWMSIEFLTQHKREKQQKDRRKIHCCWCCADQKNSRSFFFLLVHFSFSIFAVDYSTHRPPNGIHTHTDELYSERPATEMQPSALYIICLSALKNIFIDYFTLWRSDWAPAAMGHSFPPCKNKDVWLLQRPKSSYSFTRHEMI